MTFVSATGNKKFKSAWQPPEASMKTYDNGSANEVIEERTETYIPPPTRQKSNEIPVNNLPAQNPQLSDQREVPKAENNPKEWPPALK